MALSKNSLNSTSTVEIYGCDQNTVYKYNTVSGYLENRTQCLKLGCKLSYFKHITKGVPHGSILG